MSACMISGECGRVLAAAALRKLCWKFGLKPPDFCCAPAPIPHSRSLHADVIARKWGGGVGGGGSKQSLSGALLMLTILPMYRLAIAGLHSFCATTTRDAMK